MPAVKNKIQKGIAEIHMPYKPMPKQHAAHALAAKYRSFCGGWGNGKTSWGCSETFIRLMEYPGTRAIVARKTRPELKSTSWDMLLNGDRGSPHAWHGIPKAMIKNYNKSDLVIEFHNGSVIYGLPLDDPAKLENYNLGFFWIDQAEEIDEDIFLKFHGRLRQLIGPREGILTWNPHGHGWLWKRFIDPNRPIRWAKNYKCIEATTYDNFNLPQDYLDQFEGLPEAWIQRYVYGSHEVFVGQIFTDWDPDIHVVQPFRIPSDWRRVHCIDPGIRHEGAHTWLAQDYKGNFFYYRELLKSDQPISWWVTEMMRLEGEDNWGGPDEYIERRLIGPEAYIRSQTDGRSVMDLYEEYGIYPEAADKDPAARISVITTALRPREGHRNPFTGNSPAPRLYVFADCEKLIEYLPQYRWKPQRPNYSDEEPPEKPRKKDDHNIDCLGHTLLAIADRPEPKDEGRKRGMTTEQALKAELEEEVYAEAEKRKSAGYHPLGRRAA